jgi:hypothetical protein
LYNIGKLSQERLTEKRDHATRHPDGRTAELVGHIDYQEQKIALLEEALEDSRSYIAKLARLIVARIMWGNKKQDMIARSAYERAGERYSLIVEDREASIGLKLLVREPGINMEVHFIGVEKGPGREFQSSELQ